MARVFLVPAHANNNNRVGAYDPGAVGSGTNEATVSAEVTAAVAELLAPVVPVLIVPNGTLSSRAQYLVSHMNAGDWAFSLHMNSGGGRGTEVIYDDMKPGLRDEAAAFSKSLATAFGLPDRKAKPDSITPRKYLGLVSRPPRTFIVEMAFQDDPEQVKRVQERGALAVSTAIRSLLSLPPHMPFTPTNEQQNAFRDMQGIGVFNEYTPKTQERYELALILKRMFHAGDKRWVRLDGSNA